VIRPDEDMWQRYSVHVSTVAIAVQEIPNQANVGACTLEGVKDDVDLQAPMARWHSEGPADLSPDHTLQPRDRHGSR